METLKSAKSKLAAANKEITGFIGAFVDDSSFVETDAFVCSQNDFGEMPSEGVVSGIATIDSRYVCVFATNPEVLKGSIGAVNAKKNRSHRKQCGKDGQTVDSRFGYERRAHNRRVGMFGRLCRYFQELYGSVGERSGDHRR